MRSPLSPEETATLCRRSALTICWRSRLPNPSPCTFPCLACHNLAARVTTDALRSVQRSKNIKDYA